MDYDLKNRYYFRKMEFILRQIFINLPASLTVCWSFALFLIVYPIFSFSQEPDVETILIDEEDEDLWLEEEAIESAQSEPSDSNTSLDSSQTEEAPSSDTSEVEPSGTSLESDSSSTNELADEGETSEGEALTSDSMLESTVDPYEQELHTVYKQYYEQKISQTEWQKIISQVSGDIYTIQSKDTLWDISKMLFGDPHYWPKLWSVNASIGNPHLIQPGYDLGFIYGTADSPPLLKLVDSSAPVSGMQAKAISKKTAANLLKGKNIKVPPPVQYRYPIMQAIPSSLPLLSLSQKEKDRVDMSKLAVHFGGLQVSFQSFLNYFMSDNPVESVRVGSVLRKKDNNGKWSQTTERVILEIDDFVQAGHLLTVARDLGKLYKLPRGVGGPTGYQIEIQGEVKVIGRLPHDEHLYEAEVTKAVNPVMNGSILIDQTLPEFDFHKTDTFGTGSAQIIGLPSAVKPQVTAAPYNFVYLNRGSKDGFAVGQMYQVRANKKVREEFIYGYDIPVGELKIIYTEEQFATAIVTNILHPIHIGDYVGSHQSILTGGEHQSILHEEDIVEDKSLSPKEMAKQMPEDVEMIDEEEDADLEEIFEQSEIDTTEKPLSETELETDEFDEFDEDDDWEPYE